MLALRPASKSSSLLRLAIADVHLLPAFSVYCNVQYKVTLSICRSSLVTGRQQGSRPSKGSQRFVGCSRSSPVRIDRFVFHPQVVLQSLSISEGPLSVTVINLRRENLHKWSHRIHTAPSAGAAQAIDPPVLGKGAPQILSPKDAKDQQTGKVDASPRLKAALAAFS